MPGASVTSCGLRSGCSDTPPCSIRTSAGRANLEFFAELYRVGARRVQELGERFEVTGYWERPARTYSRGQLQRVALARALLHQPRLILLDEPSAGLDARSLQQLVEAVKVERARGAIIALITHDAALSDEIADERVRLTRGRVTPVEEARA